jgi:hypothetical protein
MLTAPAWAASPPAGPLKPYTAEYSISKGVLTVAHGRYKLQLVGNDCYLYSGHAHSSGIVSLFSGDAITEQSQFCIVNGKIRPQRFRFHHKGGKKDHNYALVFNWDRNTVAVKREDEEKATIRKIPPDAKDDLTMQLYLRQVVKRNGGKMPEHPVQIHLATRNHVRTYSFQGNGRDTADTGAGKFASVNVSRVHPGDKQIHYYFAPQLDYLPVKIVRQDSGLTLKLASVPDNLSHSTQAGQATATSAPERSSLQIRRHSGF